MKRIYLCLFSERATRMLCRGKLFPLLCEHYDVALMGPPDLLNDEFPDVEVIGIDPAKDPEPPDLAIGTSNHLAPSHYWDVLSLCSSIARREKTLVIQHFFDAIFHHQIFIPDLYCCWSEWFADEISAECLRHFWLHTYFTNYNGLINLTTRDVGVPKKKMRVTGSLNHDFLVEAPIKSREEFCDQFGFDPAKPIIMNTPIGLEKEECHNDLMAVTRICHELDTQLIFSPHPMNYAGLKNYKKILENSKANYVISIDPEMEDVEKGSFDYFDPGVPFCGRRFLPEEQHRMANFFTHVDVMTSIGNTTNLEAMIFDTPAVINATNWEAGQQHFKKWSLKKYYDILAEFDCVDIVYNLKDYKQKIIGAIENPKKRSEQRKHAVRQFFHEVDGKAYLRVFDVIRELLED